MKHDDIRTVVEALKADPEFWAGLWSILKAELAGTPDKIDMVAMLLAQLGASMMATSAALATRANVDATQLLADVSLGLCADMGELWVKIVTDKLRSSKDPAMAQLADAMLAGGGGSPKAPAPPPAEGEVG